MKNLYIKELVGFAVIYALFSIAQAVAAPVILPDSGILNDGEQFTVSGAGFGEKTTAPPIVFEDFDGSGPSGTELRDVSADLWTVHDNETSGGQGNLGTAYFTILNLPTRSRDGSMFCNAWMNTGIGEGTIDTAAIEGMLTSKGFYSLWIRYDAFHSVFGSAAPQSLQMKFFRMFPAGDYDGFSNLDVKHNPFFESGPSFRATLRYGSDSPDFDLGDWENGSWTRVDMAVQHSSVPNAPDGRIYAWVNGRKVVPDEVNFTDFTDPMITHTDRKMDSFQFGEWMGVSEDGIGGYANIGYDDIYVDNSWARVEIGNAPVFNDCTHREMQVPVAWADDKITFTVNSGTFLNDEKIYLFVVDENGIASEGKEFTITGKDGKTGISGGCASIGQTNEGNAFYSALVFFFIICLLCLRRCTICFFKPINN